MIGAVIHAHDRRAGNHVQCGLGRPDDPERVREYFDRLKNLAVESRVPITFDREVAKAITYPAKINALLSLISFAVSGIYLSFLLTVIGSMIAPARGWERLYLGAGLALYKRRDHG